jgi:hypothetical protein
VSENATAANTAQERLKEAGKNTQFKVGNPGRPKGSRNKLGEAFLADMLSNWEEHGRETIEQVRVEKPDQYLKVVASILPKELNIQINELDELNDEQLYRQFASITAQLAAAGIDLGARDTEATGPQEAGSVPAIH